MRKKILFFLLLLGIIVCQAQTVYRSFNPKASSAGNIDDMLSLSYKDLFHIDYKSLTEGIKGNPNGGKIEVRLYAYDSNVTDGKGKEIYYSYLDESSLTAYKFKTQPVKTIIASGSAINTISNDIKKRAQAQSAQTKVESKFVFIAAAAVAIVSFGVNLYLYTSVDPSLNLPNGVVVPHKASPESQNVKLIAEVQVPNGGTLYDVAIPGVKGNLIPSGSDELVNSFADLSKIEKSKYIIRNRKLFPNYTILAAHRGYWKDAPENSTKAYDDAIALGADMVELDVRSTKDDTLVVWHDRCLDRLTSGSGRMQDKTYSEIKPLYVKNYLKKNTTYRILTLREAYQHLKGKVLIALDLKDVNDVSVQKMKYNQSFIECLKMAKQIGVLDQILIKGKMSPEELIALLNEADVRLEDIIFTPVCFGGKTISNTNIANQYLPENSNKSLPIYGIELVYKQSNDGILPYILRAEKRNIWVGQYSFWPENCAGVEAEPQNPTDCGIIDRDYNFTDNGDFSDFLNDGRGDWDWLTFPSSLAANYFVTDRPELMNKYLQGLGKRSTKSLRRR